MKICIAAPRKVQPWKICIVYPCSGFPWTFQEVAPSPWVCGVVRPSQRGVKCGKVASLVGEE